MYTKLEMLAIMADDVCVPELRLYAPRKEEKRSWLKRLLGLH